MRRARQRGRRRVLPELNGVSVPSRSARTRARRSTAKPFDRLVVRHVTLLIRRPDKKGKTWVMMHMACATAVGAVSLGAFPARRSAQVLVVENEYGAE
jgi:hypothetical protein